MEFTRGRPSPAIVLAVIALVFAMAGSAIAGTDALSSKITKSKVKKIAKKQINKAAPGLDVKSAKTADKATNADNATNAANAANATNATNAAAVNNVAVRSLLRSGAAGHGRREHRDVRSDHAEGALRRGREPDASRLVLEGCQRPRL